MFQLLALLASAPAAAADGYWHPADLSAESQLFRRLNEGSLGPFDDRSRRADELAQALRDYALALDLLGARAPAEERARLDALEKQFHRDKAKVEAFASALVDDVDRTFQAAVERALAQMEGSYEVCERQIPAGPQVPGMRRRMQDNPACTGEDVNARLAALLDADPTLAAEVDEILALTWPAFTIEPEARPAVGGDDRWILVAPLFRRGATDALRRIDQADENARLPFQAAIEEGASKEELARLATEAEKVDAATAAARAALGSPVLDAADKALSRWGEAAGWCANPPALGGCAGEDATGALVPRLLDDPRVEKSLRKASDRVAG